MVTGKPPWFQLDNVSGRSENITVAFKIWSLYYVMGTWSLRVKEFRSEIDENVPDQMLRGCNVCANIESDAESIFSISDSDSEAGVVEEKNSERKQCDLELKQVVTKNCDVSIGR